MTEYFLLTQSKQLVSPPIFEGTDKTKIKPFLTKEEFDALNEVNILYFDYHEGIEIPDILNSPVFMVSTKIKHLFELYDEEIVFKGVQTFSKQEEDPMAPLYWNPYIPVCDCLHPSSETYGTGLLKELILDSEQIGDKEIVRVGGILENRIVISLAVAESLLRRELFGIGLEKVKVR